MPGSSNTSATGGPLAPPPGTAPPGDLDLDALVRDWLADLCGLDGSLVRPRWQDPADTPDGALPRVPDRGQNWIAVEITSTRAEGVAAQIHDGTGDGTTVLRRQEWHEVLASFYGPQGDALASLVRDGAFLDQNREGLRGRGFDLTKAGPIRRIPAIEAAGTRRRSDLTLTLTRTVERTYPVRNLLQAHGTLVTETSTRAFQTPDP